MLAPAPVAVLPHLRPDVYLPSSLHDGARDWPETNCYIDVWIEVLHALGEDPRSALGFTVAQDFEGDHFSFSKFPLEDIETQFGLVVSELALYNTLEAHAVEQTRRGRMVIVEVDSFFLPDTRGVSYRLEHTKTTIAINRIDPLRREIDYFHGAGLFALAGEDYDALLRPGSAPDAGLFPYAEFVKFDRRRSADGATALALLRRHLDRRPPANPIEAFRERVSEQVASAAERPNAFLHKYAFNTARQLGMNFELLGSHLEWLGTALPSRAARFHPAGESCKALSAGAKAFQFQLARAVARKRFAGIEQGLASLVSHYDRVFADLAAI